MSELGFPQGNMYAIEHVWLRMESATTALVGISDFAQTQLGEVAYVDLPDVGSAFDGGDEFGSVESLKAVSPLYMPITGTVTETNEELDGAPTLVNMEPYGKGWMLRIEIAEDADKSLLISAAQYQEGL